MNRVALRAHRLALHEATMEVKAGHLQGPLTEEELDGRYGAGAWLFTKRFALQRTPENPKTRAIEFAFRLGG